MPIVTCTPGGTSDNAYVSETQALAYVADSLREQAWEDTPQDLRQRALIQATAAIERLGGGLVYEDDSPQRGLFRGSPTSTAQALHFPVDGDGFVPTAIREAVCEQAIWLIARNGVTPLIDHDEMRRAGVAMVVDSGLTFSYRATDGGVPEGIAPGAWARVKGVLRGGGFSRGRIVVGP